MSALTDLIWPGAFVVQSIDVVARLGVADHLGPEPQTAEQLAAAVQADAESLRRVLRALTTLGVFAEDDAGRFRHTDLSRTLRADAAGSVRAWALMLGAHFDSSDDDRRGALERNLIQTVRMMRLALLHMKSRPGAAVINIPSISGWTRSSRCQGSTARPRQR